MEIEVSLNETYGQVYQFLSYVNLLDQSQDGWCLKSRTGIMVANNNDMIPSVAEIAGNEYRNQNRERTYPLIYWSQQLISRFSLMHGH
jgi:hypothetical protein